MSTAPMAKKSLHVRWMIRRDMPEVMAIERAASPSPRSEEEVVQQLRGRSTIGMIAEHRGEVAGFMVYECQTHRVVLLALAVAPRFQRMGVGSRLLERLRHKLVGRKSHVYCLADEDNPAAPRFLHACGYRAVGVVRDAFGDRDGYAMTYRKPQDDDAS